jgi:large subunit ribosomal protein L15
MTQLHQLPKTVSRARRLGRGISAGQGKSAGRGTKGQKSRSGFNIPAGFEGGQTRVYMRLPKLRGGRFPHRPIISTVSLAQLEAAYKEGEKVNPTTLKLKGLIPKNARTAKIVGTGILKKQLKFRGLRFTTSVYEQYVQGKTSPKTDKASA